MENIDGDWGDRGTHAACHRTLLEQDERRENQLSVWHVAWSVGDLGQSFSFADATWTWLLCNHLFLFLCCARFHSSSAVPYSIRSKTKYQISVSLLQ